MSSIENIKRQKRQIICSHTLPENRKGIAQVAATLVPLAVLWWIATWSTAVSYWLTATVTLVMSFFLLRAFVLMHDCGHGSLFRTGRLNRGFGFILGVVTGMPQYVWSQHHAYHHSTNGNWEKYRGPLNTATVEEFQQLTVRKQRAYESARSVWLAPFAGFVYLLLNPRISWLKGTIALIGHVIGRKIARPDISIPAHAATFETRHWASAEECRHMTWNNIVLFSCWLLMSYWVGPVLFFAVYVVSVSLAGGAGIALFTVQHNFEHAYASGDEGWDYDTAAIRGTSFLILPRWLNWFTANIAYHHVHHLSAKIPNYCLVACHDEHAQLFSGVPSITLQQIPHAMKHILWDTQARRIISVAEYRQQVGVAVPGHG